MEIARRDFMAAAAVGLTGIRFNPGLMMAAHPSSDQAAEPVLWIDPKQAALPTRPWRKVHLDFHNSRHIQLVSEHFDPDEFGATLLKANVNPIVVFAKDMHGYSSL